jgi:hypothetical protein
MPNGTERLSEITIDLINQYFKLTTVKNDRTVEHIVSNGKSIFRSRKEFTEEEVKTFSLTALNSCKTTIPIYTVYETKDPGTIISSVVNRKILGKEYLVLKVKYEENQDRFLVFYFEPKLML